MVGRLVMLKLNCCVNNKSENDGKFLVWLLKIEMKDEIYFVN